MGGGEIVLLYANRGEVNQPKRLIGLFFQRFFQIFSRSLEVVFTGFEGPEIDQHPGGRSAGRNGSLQKSPLIFPIESSVESPAAEKQNPSRAYRAGRSE